MKKYIQIDEQGNILKDILTSVDYSGREDFVEVPRDSAPLFSKGTNKIRWDRETNQLVEKRQIRFVVGTTRFPADGKTTVAICVRGDNLSKDEEVEISIDGESHTITKAEHIEIYSNEPGVFHVALNDSKYSANPSSYTIYAAEPVDDKE